MSLNTSPPIMRTVCPHDCPCTCALDVEILDDGSIGRVRGAKDDPYTDGVICAKVARYKERVHHPDRLTKPLRRIGPKGNGQFAPVDWDEALDEIADQFKRAEAEFGPQSVFPYHYAGTMGHIQRDLIGRFARAKGYSQQYETICATAGNLGFMAGAGEVRGISPLEMAHSDVIVIWGTNVVNTQISVMTHAIKARKARGAHIVAIDIYDNETLQQADTKIILKPGSDGALACALMHILLRDGIADQAYLARYTDFDGEVAQHFATKTPQWAAEITGLEVEQIEDLAALIGTHKKTFFRLGYGLTRQHNGAANMHAALCVPAMTGAWQVKGGGALHTNSGSFGLKKGAILGEDISCDSRMLDMSLLGRILTGDKQALGSDVPVKAMLVQNTNPAVVNPEQSKVIAGLKREDLFLAVHEHFLTETAELADIVLPATMFVEQDDFYTRGGHTRILYGPKLIDGPKLARSNHWVLAQLAKRLEISDEIFAQSTEALVDATLDQSFGEDFTQQPFLEREADFKEAHFLNGFVWKDKKFRFRPNWLGVMEKRVVQQSGKLQDLPSFADHWPINSAVDDAHPLKLATSPARSFLNSTFTQDPTSIKKEGEPYLLMRYEDAVKYGVKDAPYVTIGNNQGEVTLKLKLSDKPKKGTVIAPGLFPNKAHRGGWGINLLTSAAPIAPFGGAAFHDVAVWVRVFGDT